MLVGRLLSYWEGNLSGAILNFRGYLKYQGRPEKSAVGLSLIFTGVKCEIYYLLLTFADIMLTSFLGKFFHK